MAVVGYSPFGSGSFPREPSGGGAVLREIAQAYGVRPRQVALAFLLRYRSTFVIPKASTVAHVVDNAKAADLQLDDASLARLDAAFPEGAPRGLPTL